MMNAKRLLGLAALLAAISAIVHLAGAALADFALVPLAAGLAWLLFAAGFKARYRWLAYIGFLVAIAGALTAYATLPSEGPLQTVSVAMIGVNSLLVVVLFLVIWRPPGGTAV